MDEFLATLKGDLSEMRADLANLKQLRNENHEEIAKLWREVTAVRESVHNIEVMVAGMQSRPICAAPSLCVELKRVVEQEAVKVRALEENATQGKLVAKIAIAIIAFGSSVLGGIAVHFAGKHI